MPREDDDNTGAVVYDGNSLPVTICSHVYELGLNIAKTRLISGHFYYIYQNNQPHAKCVAIFKLAIL